MAQLISLSRAGGCAAKLQRRSLGKFVGTPCCHLVLTFSLLAYTERYSQF